MNVTDGIHTASTFVEVTVLDANDNAPEFTERTYKIENKLVEEDTSVITSPKLLVQVSGNTSMLSYWKSDYHFLVFFCYFFSLYSLFSFV